MTMEYALELEGTPDSLPAGSALLLLHPSTGETDRIDTQFLNTDTDQMLIISTRTSAREVKQKLEHYDVDESRATILDTISVERGYTRRRNDHVRYISQPENLDGIVEETEQFLEETEGKRRVSLDSITEMIYYADEDTALTAVDELLSLLESHDSVGLFHLARGVHEDRVVDEFRERFDGVLELGKDDTLATSFED